MRKKFHDPNNHVPEVTAGDDWDDGVVDAWDDDGSGKTLLPGKRAANEKPAFREVKKDEEDKGIEIDVNILEKVSRDPKGGGSVQRLEVQEHVPKLLAPEVAPLPKVVPKQVIEKPVVDEEHPPEEDRRQRAADQDNWGKEKTVPVRWMLVSGGVLALVVLLIAIFLPKMGWENEKRATSIFSQIEVESMTSAPSDKTDMDLGENVEEDAKKLMGIFVNAKSPEEILPVVRDRARVEAAIRERWKPMNLPAGWTIPDTAEWAIRKAGKRDFGYLGGFYPDITAFHYYFVRENDRVVIDWEASTGYSQTRFEDLVKNQGDGGAVRGILAPADLYTVSLPEADYQCYRLGSPNQELSVWGYVKRDTPAAEQLAQLFVQGAIPREIFTEYPITVSLAKAPADSLPNQWLITEMLHIDWISP